jgi:acylphosphatase
MPAKRYIVRGNVQGVGFRHFAQKTANSLGVNGYVRNADDGSVEIYATGNDEQLTAFAGHLWRGPGMAQVKHVEEHETAPKRVSGFNIE